MCTRTGNVDCFLVKDLKEIDTILKEEMGSVNCVIFDNICASDTIKYSFRIFEDCDDYLLSIITCETVDFDRIKRDLAKIDGITTLDIDI